MGSVTALTVAGKWKDIEDNVLTDNQSPVTIDSKGFTMSSDGKYAFITHSSPSRIEKRRLDTAYDPNITTLSQSVNISVTTPGGIAIKDDGTKIYVVDSVSLELVEFDCNVDPNTLVPDLDTLVLSGNILDLTVTTTPDQCKFSPTGSFVFITNGTAVYSFPLPTDWDLTSNVSNSNYAPGGDANSVEFKRQGDIMYIGSASADTIRQYTLDPVFDISSPSLTGTKDLTQDTPTFEPESLYLRSNGDQILLLDFSANDLARYHFEESYDITSCSHFANFFDLGENTRGAFWKPDGMRFYTIENNNRLIKEWDAKFPHNQTDATFVSEFETQSIDNVPQALYIINNGTELYFTGNENKNVYKLVMSSWDLSSAVFDSQVNPSELNENPQGIYVRRDRLKYWVSMPEEIIEFTMPTPGDLTNSTVNGNTFTPEGTIRDITFKPDISQLFTANSDDDTVDRYELTDRENIGSAQFKDSMDILIENSVQGLFINGKKGKVYVVGLNQDELESYDIGSEFNNAIITELGEELITNDGENIVWN